jgi:hypothetical protein
MSSNRSFRVVIDTEISDGRSNINISFPKNQDLLSIQETSHILAGAISLLIKSSSKGDKIKDYELIKEVINHLNSEFVNIDSFSDLYVNPKMV